MTANTTAVIVKDELPRAEWVSRVSALDLYIHELIFERLVPSFEADAPLSPAANKIQIPLVAAETVRPRTYQYPDAIADGIRTFSSVELWNAISIRRGNIGAAISVEAKLIKSQLSLIIERRNKIAHEGDMVPSLPRASWPITPQDVALVRSFIERLVVDIDAVV